MHIDHGVFCSPVSRPWPTLMATVAALVLLTLVTLTRWPTVWVDESYFVDPAVNLAAKRQFTSDFAFAAAKNDLFLESRVWPGNCPLYSIALGYWIRAFGFGLFSARLLNVVFFAGGVLLATAAVLRCTTARRGLVAAGMPLLLFCSYPMPFMYRSCRYDALSFLECAAILYALTIRTSRVQLPILALAGFLLPWTGLPACILVAAALAVGATFRRELLPSAVVVAAAMALGGIAFIAWLWHYDALAAFRYHAQAVQARSRVGQGTLPRLLRGLAPDRSTMILWVASLALVCRRILCKDCIRTSPAVAAMAITGAAHAARTLANSGNYPWMSASVLAIGFLADLGSSEVRRSCLAARACLAVACAGMAASMLMLPAVTWVAAFEWNARDHARVVSFVGRHVRPDDHVFADYSAYFACTALSHTAFVDSGARGGLPGDYVDVDDAVARRVPFSVAVVRPERAAETLRRFGPGWSQVAAMPATEAARPDQRPAGVGAVPNRILQAIYPPSLSQAMSERIAPDRPYALVVLRNNGSDTSRP